MFPVKLVRRRVSPEVERAVDRPIDTLQLPDEVLGGLVFRADAEASVIARPDSSALIRLGAARLGDALCLDPRTDAIVAVDDPNLPYLLRPEWWEGFVNTDLAKFTATANAITARLPYYARSVLGTEQGWKEMDTVHSELLAVITAIDPPAASPDQFWSTFTDDVAMGDFATEDLIELAASRDIAAR